MSRFGVGHSRSGLSGRYGANVDEKCCGHETNFKITIVGMFFIIFFVFAMIFMPISIAGTVEKRQWNISECLVKNVSRSSHEVYNHGHKIYIDDIWNVIEKENLFTIIRTYGTDIDAANKDLINKPIGFKGICFHKINMNELVWTLEDIDIIAIMEFCGYTAMICAVLSFINVFLFGLFCIRKNYIQYFLQNKT